MKSFQHDFDRVEDYLHHRDPYLLVDEIVSLGPTRIVTRKFVTGDEYFLKGHFPGAPVFPGAMMQESTSQTAGILIAARHNPMRVYNTHDPSCNEFALGVLVRVRQARYRGFARPGDRMEIAVTLHDRVRHLFDFSAVISVGSRTIMKNRFQLTNIPSQTLLG